MSNSDPLQQLLATAWKNTMRNKRRAKWDAGARPECREHPGVVVERVVWISSGRLLCRACLKARRKMSRQAGAISRKFVESAAR